MMQEAAAEEEVQQKIENAKLKKLRAEAMLDNAMLKDIAAKNGDARRQAGSRRSDTCR